MTFFEGRPVLVLGATGNQGGAVARRLTDDGIAVRAFARDAASSGAAALQRLGAEIIEGDLQDTDALERAAKGAYGVFCVLPFFTSHQQQETRIGMAVADAAKAAGVEHFVYSSAAGAHRSTGVPHLDSKWLVEQHIRYIDLPATVLRPVAFNNSLLPYRDPALRDGVLSDSRPGHSRVAQIAEEDFAAFVSLALREPDEWLDVNTDVASDIVSVAELAAVIGRVLDRPVRHEQIGWTYTRAAYGGEIARLMRWVDAVGTDLDIIAFRARFPWLTPLETWMRAHDWAGQAD